MILVLAFVVGLVSLGAEVSFTWTCERLLGQTNSTVAVVLVAWLLGLALGARLGGAPSGPTQAWRTLRTALLGLGALVVATAFALPSLAAVPVPDADGFPWARGASVALLLLPVPLAAGAAFPALVRLAAVRAPSAAGRVYASETSGAVVGALLAGFLLVRFLGHLHAAVALGALALATGALVAVAFRREGWVAAAAAVPPSEPDGERLPASHLLAIALGGAAALALELLWTRVLLFFVPGLTGALAAVLGGVLLGTSLGAAAGAWARARLEPRRAASHALLLGAAGVCGSLLLLPHLADLVRLWPSPPGGGFQPGHELVVSFLAAAGVTFLPTAASGAAFALLAAGGGARGASTAYSAACLGSVAGVVAAATLAGSVVPSRAAIAAAGVVLAAASLLPRARGDRGKVALAGAAVAAGLLLAPRDAPLLAQSVEFRKTYAAGRTVLAAEEDAHGVASVVDLGDGRGRALYTNAFLAASTQAGYGYMRMLGHLPALLARQPARALVIAYGTGTTVGSLALHPEVRSIEIAEISPAVLELAPWFEEVNRGVPYARTLGKEVRVRIADGRAVVERPGEPFDVLTLEPLPPETPAAVHFYTREFYRSAHERLSDGGVLCQWIPLHTSDPHSFRVLLRTFALEMPSTWLFLFDQCALLVGHRSAHPTIPLGLVTARARVVAADLVEAGLEDAAAVLGAYVADGAAILAATEDVEAMRDDRPTVALRLARPARTSLDDLAANARLLARLDGDVTALLDGSGLDPAEFEQARAEVGAAARAKRLLREWRAVVGEDPRRAATLLLEVLRVRPGDLEAAARLGRAPASVPSLAASEDEAALETLEDRTAAKDLAELCRALERAGTSTAIPAASVLPYLEHDSADVRLKAMVALERRVGDLGAYDPLAPAAARRAAVAALERRLGAQR